MGLRLGLHEDSPISPGHFNCCRIGLVRPRTDEADGERSSDQSRELRERLLGGLAFDGVIVFAAATILQKYNLFAQGVLELKHTWELQIEAFRFVNTLDVGPKRFSQVDCGEHLHSVLPIVPQFCSQEAFQLVTSVTALPVTETIPSLAALRGDCIGCK